MSKGQLPAQLEQHATNFFTNHSLTNWRMLNKTIKQMKKEITQEDYNNMKEARDYFMEKYNNLKTLNMNTTTTDKQKIKKIADI